MNGLQTNGWSLSGICLRTEEQAAWLLVPRVFPLRYFHSQLTGKLLALASCCIGSHANESHTQPGSLIAISHSHSLTVLRMGVNWVNPVHLFRRLYRLNIQIDDYWLLSAARDNTAQLLSFTRIDLLMRHERWNIDKVARSCFRNEFEMLPPAHTCPTPDYVNDTLQFAMMVCACLGVGFDREGACPQFASAGPCIGNGSRA